MKKQTVTLETISQKIEEMHREFGSNIHSLQTSVDFLVGNAVMREELGPAIEAKIKPMESRIIAAIDEITGKNRNIEDEQLAHTYRIDRLEKHVGLSAT